MAPAEAEPAAVYLSPHLDDVALSCGGQIAERVRAGQLVRVITVFAADEPAEAVSGLAARLHRLWDLAGPVVAARRREDHAACARLGAEPEHWEELEAIYRVDAAGSPLYGDRDGLYGPPATAERELEERLARRLGRLPASYEVVSPLAVGGHVDHQLVRRAAEAALGARLSYYEDYPYSAWEPAALEAALTGAGWSERTLPVSRPALQARVEAIAAYGSQLGPLFGGRWRMARQVKRFVRERGGERVWRRTGSP